MPWYSSHTCLPQVLVKGEGGESEWRPSASPKRESTCQAGPRAGVWFTRGVRRAVRLDMLPGCMMYALILPASVSVVYMM